jgi:hypothetical protein
LWVIDESANVLLRYSLGRRAYGAYLGAQPRLLYMNQVPTTQALLYGNIVINKNGIAAVYSPTASTVTLIDTTANNHTGAVLVTTGAFASTIDYVKASAADGTFWVAVHNTSLVNINSTTGATIATKALTTPGTIYFDVSPDGTVIYLWTSAYGGIQMMTVSSGALTNGTTGLSNVNNVNLSPNGLVLLIGSASYQTWGIAKLAIATVNTLPSSSTAFTYAARLGTQLNNVQVYSICFSTDSARYFFAGLDGVWGYGFTNTMVVFDGQSTDVGGAAIGYIAVSDDDGIYIDWSGGSSPAAFVQAFPGSTFVCDPNDVNGNGPGYCEVLL